MRVTYENHIRPMLFRLSAERAHDLAQAVLRRETAGRLLGAGGRSDPALSCRLGTIECANPVGLAPGFDKDGRLIRALDHLGFGYLMVGSITPEPRRGNPKPRLARYPDERAIGNAMGLPSLGAERVAAFLAEARDLTTPVVANVTGFDVGAVCDAVARLAPLVAGIELSLVCRNADGTSPFTEAPVLGQLLRRVGAAVDCPVFVKLPSYHDAEARRRTLALLEVCVDAQSVAGVSVIGTQRREQPALAVGHGSLAGAPVLEDTLRITAEVAERSGGLAVKAAGGVMSGRDAARLLDAGATTVELYSALVYRGPRVARAMCEELRDIRAAAPDPDSRR